jgi:hypothetical protein
MANNNIQYQQRKRERDFDISESYYLLIEIGTQEPVMQHCLKTLQGMCLSQGIQLTQKGIHDQVYICPTSHISLFHQCVYSHRAHQDPETKRWSSQATDQFQKHLEKHWVPFCEEAIRMFYVCGFMPWHVRRLGSTGDLVPEVLPLGTFSWRVELRSEKEKRRQQQQQSKGIISYVPNIVRKEARKDEVVTGMHGEKGEKKEDLEKKEGSNHHHRIEKGHPIGSKNVKADSESKYTQYKITVHDGALTEEEIYIYDFVPARYDICMNSMMYATVPSPMSHILVDYKNLRQAQIRRSYADAWNTQSHIITMYKPGAVNNNIPEWKGFNYGAGDMDLTTPAPDGANPLALLFDTNGEMEVICTCFCFLLPLLLHY